MTVTSRPRWRAEAATSAPIQPDDDGCAPAVHPLVKEVRVVDAAQVQHSVELGARNSQPARLGASGEQQSVVAQHFAVVESHLPARGVQANRSGAEPHLDVVLGVEPLVVDVDLLAADLAAQIVLGERRALVWPLVLGADKHDPPVEPLLPERLGGLRAGQAGSDDDLSLVIGHGSSS
jgi:hypothetical protein